MEVTDDMALKAARGFPGGILYCSFCGRSEKEVLTLIAGPTVFICDGCVDMCVEIVAEKRAENQAVTIDQPPG